MKCIGIRESFIGHEEADFKMLLSYIIDTAKEIFLDVGTHTATAFIVLNDGSLYHADLTIFPNKDAASYFLKSVADFPGTYGIVMRLESWVKKMDKDDPSTKEITSGKKQVSDCDDKEESLVIIAATSKDFKEMIMIPIIRTEDDKIVLGPDEKINADATGRFCNLFSKDRPEKIDYEMNFMKNNLN